MGAAINIWLRSLSIHAMCIGIMWGLFPQHLEWMFGIPLKQVTIIDKTGGWTHFMKYSFAWSCFCVSSLAGYAATFFVPHDKVKVARSIFWFFIGLTWLHYKDVMNGKPECTSTVETGYIIVAQVAFHAILAFIFSFTKGGPKDHALDQRGHSKKIS